MLLILTIRGNGYVGYFSNSTAMDKYAGNKSQYPLSLFFQLFIALHDGGYSGYHVLIFAVFRLQQLVLRYNKDKFKRFQFLHISKYILFIL